MAPIDWKNLDDKGTVTIPAKPADGIWTLVRTYVSGPTILRLEATGAWRPDADLPSCTADGLRHWAYGREMLLTKKAPLGALIGKFGGSSCAAEDTDVFVIGSVTVLTIEKAVGPLYMTINDAPNHFDDNEGELTVRIS